MNSVETTLTNELADSIMEHVSQIEEECEKLITLHPNDRRRDVRLTDKQRKFYEILPNNFTYSEIRRTNWRNKINNREPYYADVCEILRTLKNKGLIENKIRGQYIKLT